MFCDKYFSEGYEKLVKTLGQTTSKNSSINIALHNTKRYLVGNKQINSSSEEGTSLSILSFPVLGPSRLEKND